MRKKGVCEGGRGRHGATGGKDEEVWEIKERGGGVRATEGKPGDEGGSKREERRVVRVRRGERG